MNAASETVLYVRNLMDDNSRLLRVIRLRLVDGSELTAEIEETIAEIQEIAERWKGDRPTRRERVLR